MTLSCFLIGCWLLLSIGQPVFAEAGRNKKSKKRNEKSLSLVYFKNETWKSRWKWNLLISGGGFSALTIVFTNSKQNFVRTRDDISLDEDKKVLDDEIKTHDTIIALGGSLAVLSLGSSIYLFLSDDSGVKSVSRYQVPEMRISPRKAQLSWGVSF